MGNHHVDIGTIDYRYYIVHKVYFFHTEFILNYDGQILSF